MLLCVLVLIWYCGIGILTAGEVNNSTNGDVDLHTSEPSGDAISCTTPAHKNGTCVALTKCKELFALLRSNRVREPSVVQFLRKSKCSQNGSTIHVCCASEAKPSVIRDPHPTFQCGKIEGQMTTISNTFLKKGEWPWMTALYCTDNSSGKITYQCGGSLISGEWVITAAHCVTCGQKNRNITLTHLRVGDLESNDNATFKEVPIKEIVLHPQYELKPLKNDIALIRLNQSIEFTRSILPICLLNGKEYESESFYAKKKPISAGWSFTGVENATLPSRKFERNIPVINATNCNQTYAPIAETISIDDRVICAEDGVQNECSGDVGESLMFSKGETKTYFLGGILSFGGRCEEKYPAVYTKVAAFINWINKSTGLSF